MTGFDETVPTEGDDARDDIGADPDDVGGRTDEPAPMGGDDDLRAGQYGPDPTR